MNEPERVVESEIVKVEDLHSGAAHRDIRSPRIRSPRFAARGFAAARSTEPHQPRWRLPLVLFLATCFSTYLTGGLRLRPR